MFGLAEGGVQFFFSLSLETWYKLIKQAIVFIKLWNKTLDNLYKHYKNVH